MFGKDFYPTPPELLDSLGLNVQGKRVLEPSAGKGNIIDWCKFNGADKIYTFEINPDLAKIVSSKSEFLGNDFLKADPVSLSHIEIIIANPPFSSQQKHILKMWEVAPEGCEIITLCNYDSLTKGYTKITEIIKDYGYVEDIGNAFTNAERQTEVHTGVLRLFKPILSENFDYEGFYIDNEPENTIEGVVHYNEIKALVYTYIAAVKSLDNILNEVKNLNDIIQSNYSIELKDNSQNNYLTKEKILKELQKSYWELVIKKLDIEKFYTEDTRKKLNSFVETNTKYPFTVKNIYRMIEIIFATRKDTMKNALVSVIDTFTKYTHENRYGVEGWKTNKGYLLNQKFIINGILNQWSSYIQLDSWGNAATKLIDLHKLTCYIMGEDYENHLSYHDLAYLFMANKYATNYSVLNYVHLVNIITKNNLSILSEKDKIPDESKYDNLLTIIKSHGFLQPMMTGKWYNWAYWSFKVYKKGSMHLKFKDEKVWRKVNQAYAKAIGERLPERI